MDNIKKAILTPLVAVSLFAGGAAGVAVLASAQTTGTTTSSQATSTPAWGMHRGMNPGVAGTVSAVSGTTITVTGKNNTSYTVDVTNAKILKGNQGAAPSTISVSDIKVGDMVGVQGTISGTSVTATQVMDGMFMRGGFGPGKGPGGMGAMGTVSAVSGNTITLTGKNGTTYTVDATGATVSKLSTVSVADIQVGDTIGVDGTVSGTSVTAKHIMDGMPTKPQTQ